MAAEEIGPGKVTITTRADWEREAQDCTDRIVAGIHAQASVYEDIYGALELRHWKTLGYGSPAEWAEESGITRAWREAGQRGEKVLPDLVAKLRDAGLNQAQVGGALGLSQSQISRIGSGRTGHESRAKAVTSGYAPAHNPSSESSRRSGAPDEQGLPAVPAVPGGKQEQTSPGGHGAVKSSPGSVPAGVAVTAVAVPPLPPAPGTAPGGQQAAEQQAQPGCGYDAAWHERAASLAAYLGEHGFEWDGSQMVKKEA